MDKLFPETSQEIMLSRAACVTSTLRGDVPYCRRFGIDARLDAAVTTDAQILLGDAAAQVEIEVPNAQVTRGTVGVDASGRALVRLVVRERDNG